MHQEKLNRKGKIKDQVFAAIEREEQLS